MKITFGNLAHLSAVGLMVLSLWVAGCKSSSGSRTTGQKRQDRDVARAVEKKLSEDPTYKYNNVHVNVYDGNAQLTGFANTPDQRTRAAELAAHAQGVQQVINNIMLSPTPTGPATIRDPYGREGGRLLLNTNAPSPGTQNAPESQAVPQSQVPGAGTTQQGTSQQP